MGGFFNPNNMFWRGFGRIADFFLLSACWLLCCVPVLTIIPASIALYDSVSHGLLMGESEIYRRFLRTLRAELKRGIGLSALWIGLGVVSALGYWFLLRYAPDSFRDLACGGLLILLLTFAATVIWLIPIESRFVYSFGALHKTAFAFVFLHFPATAFLLIVTIAGCAAIIFVPLLVMILPAPMAFIQGLVIERVFRKCVGDSPAA